MTKRQKKLIDPRLAAAILVLTVTLFFCATAVLGWSGAQHGSSGNLVVALVLLGCGVIGVGSAGSYDSATSLAYGVCGTMALFWGALFLCAGLLINLVPRLSFYGMWSVQLLAIAVIASAIEIGLTVRANGQVNHQQPGFWNAAFTSSGRQWFTGLCYIAVVVTMSLHMI